ncbi:hypothetical protein AC1031_014705 [Aphanomyces cochlioides]|nr:hypothetical protein AC1031_014705 [Aphanomyces cochlioides]
MDRWSAALGLSMQLTSCILLACVFFSHEWTTARLGMDASNVTPGSIHVGFSPRVYCIESMCYPYTLTPSTDNNGTDATLQRYVVESWCGGALTRRRDIIGLVQQTIDRETCMLAMAACNHTVIFLVVVSIVTLSMTCLCLTYWKHEYGIGCVIFGIAVANIVTHCVVAVTWILFTHASFPTTASGPSSRPSIDTISVSLASPAILLLVNSLVVLPATLWFVSYLTQSQRRRSINRLTLRHLAKHPLDCPASYA